MALDISNLTLGETALIEEMSGHSISEIGEDSSPKGLTLAALALVAKRRENPAFSWNEALALTFEQAQQILGMTDDDTDEADEADDEGEAGPTEPVDTAPSTTGSTPKTSSDSEDLTL